MAKLKRPKKLSLPISLLLILLGGCVTYRNTNKSIDNSKTVIGLTQTGCQILDMESKDYQFKTTKPEDCQKINAQTLKEREKSFKTLKLKPGRYVFNVTNRDVPYELGFYLRGETLEGETLKIDERGLNKGTSQSYEVTLKPGQYIFGCPLNPTPNYSLIVASNEGETVRFGD